MEANGASQPNFPVTRSTYFSRKPFYYFLGFWLVINLIQITFTELTSDEGYYWFYAQHLQWGYYDHPPLIALLIKAGGVLFGGESGVRFFNVLLSTGGLYLFFNLLPDSYQRSRKTWLLILSAPLLHYLSFIVFPDGPLLFFSLLFLAVYKRFLARPSVLNSVWLGVCIAGMAWAKYHGALVVLFTVIANPRLLQRRSFYAALAVALLLFLPHLWWQYQHHFPTFRYHLSGRTGTFSFKHVGEYLSQQLAAIGPGLIFVPVAVKARDVFERTLKTIIIGTFLFFLATSFKTFVHFHWTSIAVFPILYFAVQYYHQPQKQRLFALVVSPFILLFFAIRVLLLLPVIPAMHVGSDYYHGRKTWAAEIKAVAGGRPVFMPNNLREASLYSFYSGRQGVALYARQEKKSQYELWGFEDSLQGKEVAFVAKYPFAGSQPLPNNLHKNLHWGLLKNFTSYYNGVSIQVNHLQQTGDSITAEIVLINNRSTPLDFLKNAGAEKAALVFSLEQKGKVLKADAIINLTETIPPNASLTQKISFVLQGVPEGDCEVFFGIRSGVLPDAILSKSFALKKN